MTRSGIYDEIKDIQAVDQVGYVDLGEAIRNGYVPASVEGDDMVYNGIDDPSTIMRRADDVFALYRQADYIQSFGESSASDSVTREGESTQ